MIADPKVREEVKALSGEGIRPETAFRLAEAIGGIFHVKYSREVLIAMLQVLRGVYGEMCEEKIPDYVRDILKAFRAKGIPLPERSDSKGAQIFLYDRVPTEAEAVAMVSSLVLNPSSIPAGVVIYPRNKISPEEKARLEGYETRLGKMRDIDGNPVRIHFYYHDLPRRTADHIQTVISEFGRRFGKDHVVITMAEDLARWFEKEEPLIPASFYGVKQVRYGVPEAPAYYSPLFLASSRLSEREYEALQDLDRLILERETPVLYASRYDRAPRNFYEAWLITESRIREAFTQAA